MDTPNIPTENRRVNMVARRSFGGSMQRKPLADCTNIVSKSSQHTSSCAKYANPSLTSSLKRIVAQTTLKETTNHVNIPDDASKTSSLSLATNVRPVTRRISADLGFPRLVDQTTLKEKINDVNTSDAASVSASRSLATNLRRVTRRMSADVGFPASAPPPNRPKNSRSDLGVKKEFNEPYSVYSARRTSGKKRNRDASSSSAVARLRLDLIPSSGKKTRQANENKPKPPKKRQRTVKHEEDNLVDGFLKDYIEQQRAYFAEVDAFELPEEELTSSSDLD